MTDQEIDRAYWDMIERVSERVYQSVPESLYPHHVAALGFAASTYGHICRHLNTRYYADLPHHARAAADAIWHAARDRVIAGCDHDWIHCRPEAQAGLHRWDMQPNLYVAQIMLRLHELRVRKN